MNNINNLSHSRWECKYHVVWIPKCRRKVLYGQLRKYLGEVLHELARQKESKVLEGHLQSDHVHMLVSIPPKYVVSQVVSTVGTDEEVVRAYIRDQEKEDNRFEQLKLF